MCGGGGVSSKLKGATNKYFFLFFIWNNFWHRISKNLFSTQPTVNLLKHKRFCLFCTLTMFRNIHWKQQKYACVATLVMNSVCVCVCVCMCMYACVRACVFV